MTRVLFASRLLYHSSMMLRVGSLAKSESESSAHVVMTINAQFQTCVMGVQIMPPARGHPLHFFLADQRNYIQQFKEISKASEEVLVSLNAI